MQSIYKKNKTFIYSQWQWRINNNNTQMISIICVNWIHLVDCTWFVFSLRPEKPQYLKCLCGKIIYLCWIIYLRFDINIIARCQQVDIVIYAFVCIYMVGVLNFPNARATESFDLNVLLTKQYYYLFFFGLFILYTFTFICVFAF